MTRADNELEVLRRLLAATRAGKISWRSDADGYYVTDVGHEDNNRMMYRFRYVEAGPQIGADPLLLELSMPGMNGGFAIGTEGYDILFQLHSEAEYGEHDDAQQALDFLERNGL